MGEKVEVIANQALENLTYRNHLPFFIESSLDYSFFSPSLEYDEYDIKPTSVIDGGTGIDTLVFDQSLLPSNLQDNIYLFSDVEGHVAFDIFANGEYHLYETYNIEHFQLGDVLYAFDELFKQFEHEIFYDQTFYDSPVDDIFVGSAGEDTAVLNITFNQIEAYHIEPFSHFSDNTADHQVSILSEQGFDSYTDIEYFAFLDETYTFDQLVDSLIYYDPTVDTQEQSETDASDDNLPHNSVPFIYDVTNVLLKPEQYSYYDYELDEWANLPNEYIVEHSGHIWIGLAGDALLGSFYSDFFYLDPANTWINGGANTDFVKMNYATFDVYDYCVSGDSVTFFNADGTQQTLISIEYFLFDDALITFEDINYMNHEQVIEAESGPIVRTSADGLVPLIAGENGVEFDFSEDLISVDDIKFESLFDNSWHGINEFEYDEYGNEIQAFSLESSYELSKTAEGLNSFVLNADLNLAENFQAEAFIY